MLLGCELYGTVVKAIKDFVQRAHLTICTECQVVGILISLFDYVTLPVTFDRNKVRVMETILFIQ